MLILPKDKYSFFYSNGILIIAVKKMQSIEKIMNHANEGQTIGGR